MPGDGAYVRWDLITFENGSWSAAPAQNLETGDRAVVLTFRAVDGTEYPLTFPLEAARFVAAELTRVADAIEAGDA